MLCPAELWAPCHPAGWPAGSVSPILATPEAEVVGVDLWLDADRLRLLDVVGRCVLAAVEVQPHLAGRVARAGPAHQRVDAHLLARLEFQDPARGPPLAGLHGGAGWHVDAGELLREAGRHGCPCGLPRIGV